MFAPVVNRFHVYDVPVAQATRAYMDAIMALPAWKAWIADAEAEAWRIEKYESALTSARRELLTAARWRRPRPRVRNLGGRRIIAEGLEQQLLDRFLLTTR